MTNESIEKNAHEIQIQIRLAFAQKKWFTIDREECKNIKKKHSSSMYKMRKKREKTAI